MRERENAAQRSIGDASALPSGTSYPGTPFNPLDPSIWFDSATGSSCTGCHALPDVAHSQLEYEGYCTSVLARAAQRTMPPASSDPAEHPAGWSSNNGGDYQVHGAERALQLRGGPVFRRLEEHDGLEWRMFPHTTLEDGQYELPPAQRAMVCTPVAEKPG